MRKHCAGTANQGQTSTLLVTALSVARERAQGTFDQLLVAPLRPLQGLHAAHALYPALE
jgi:hypothetical protein